MDHGFLKMKRRLPKVAEDAKKLITISDDQQLQFHSLPNVAENHINSFYHERFTCIFTQRKTTQIPEGTRTLSPRLNQTTPPTPATEELNATGTLPPITTPTEKPRPSTPSEQVTTAVCIFLVIIRMVRLKQSLKLMVLRTPYLYSTSPLTQSNRKQYCKWQGGDTPLYKQYRYVHRQGVWFSSPFDLIKIGYRFWLLFWFQIGYGLCTLVMN